MHIEDKATNDLPVKTKGDSYSKFVWILALGGVVEEGRAVVRREGPPDVAILNPPEGFAIECGSLAPVVEGSLHRFGTVDELRQGVRGHAHGCLKGRLWSLHAGLVGGPLDGW